MVSIIDRWSRLGDRANAPHSVRCSSHQRRHPMNVLLGVSGLIFVSAVTPGPNNIAVLRIAGEQGLKATAAALRAGRTKTGMACTRNGNAADCVGRLAHRLVTQAYVPECPRCGRQPPS